MIQKISNFIRLNCLKSIVIKEQCSNFSVPEGDKIRIYLGDSVFLRVSNDDADKRPIKEMLRMLDLNCYVFAHSALSLSHAMFYIKSLPDKTLERIDHLFIPINMRSFSPQWEFNPKWQFKSEMMKYCNTAELSEYFGEIEKNLYLRYESEYLFIGRKTNDYFFPSSGNSHNRTILENKLKQVAHHYLWNRPIEASTRFKSLKLLIEYLNEKKVMHSFYTTPLNLEFIEYCYGMDAVEHIINHEQRILSVIDGSSYSKLISCLRLATRYDFLNLFETTEHLNENGRNKLVSRILQK